ncbi:hypothetical protein L9F63_011438, partial [Diploptera punctata]
TGIKYPTIFDIILADRPVSGEVPDTGQEDLEFEVIVVSKLDSSSCYFPGSETLLLDTSSRRKNVSSAIEGFSPRTLNCKSLSKYQIKGGKQLWIIKDLTNCKRREIFMSNKSKDLGILNIPRELCAKC